nr:uncharacterized protein LOC109775096 [Aegilops tauschii subsp. strangulata]
MPRSSATVAYVSLSTHAMPNAPKRRPRPRLRCSAAEIAGDLPSSSAPPDLADPLVVTVPLELEIELELRRLGSSAFARYRPPPPPFSVDLEPPSTPDHFPFLPRFFCSRKRPDPSTPEAPPPRDLVAGEPGHPSDRNHLHPNGDSTLSLAVPSPDLAVPCIDAGELADPLSREPLELEIELELHRLGSSAFARYRPPPPPFSVDLEPPSTPDHFPFLPRFFCSRKRLDPSTPEAPPSRDLVAGERGHPGYRNHLHPNSDSMLSPAVPSPDLAVPCIDAGELADPLSRG